MMCADVDAQYDAIHIDSNEILLRHAVDGGTSDCIFENAQESNKNVIIKGMHEGFPEILS